MATTLMD